jgi:hypothetical protein
MMGHRFDALCDEPPGEVGGSLGPCPQRPTYLPARAQASMAIGEHLRHGGVALVEVRGYEGGVSVEPEGACPSRQDDSSLIPRRTRNRASRDLESLGYDVVIAPATA